MEWRRCQSQMLNTCHVTPQESERDEFLNNWTIIGSLTITGDELERWHDTIASFVFCWSSPLAIVTSLTPEFIIVGWDRRYLRPGTGNLPPEISFFGISRYLYVSFSISPHPLPLPPSFMYVGLCVSEHFCSFNALRRRPFLKNPILTIFPSLLSFKMDLLAKSTEKLKLNQNGNRTPIYI